MSSETFNILESVYEADYTIANLANLMESSIIVSLDTDFYVMCCESPSIYIINFMKSFTLYSPRSEWNEVLEDNCGINFNKNLIYRLAPLFGNDYTSTISDKQSILSAEKGQESISIIVNKEEYPNTRQKKLSKLKNYINYSSDVITLEELDAAVLEYSKNNEAYRDFFNNYRKARTANNGHAVCFL